jgi:hypothetical protein
MDEGKAVKKNHLVEDNEYRHTHLWVSGFTDR